MIATIFFMMAIYHIVNAMLARIDNMQFKQGKLNLNSNLFFGTISSRKYDDFKSDFLKNTSEEQLNDILSQVYVNSCIAQIKHQEYNKSILCLGGSAVVTLIIIVLGVIAQMV